MLPLEAQTSETAGRNTNNFEAYLLSVIRGRRGAAPALLRFLMACLAPVYCLGLEMYLLPYTIGIRKRHRLACPVVCIGNLTTGGTGKTPMTQTICRLLQRRGFRPAVLSRGYGGEYEYGSAVVSDGEQLYLTPGQAGDEAYLLARSLPGVPVVVGKDRRITGELASGRFQPDVIILDDGMQYWQLHRDLDIVLLNAALPFDNGYTFPRGLLREPKSHLKRAGVVIITGIETAGNEEIAAVGKVVESIAPEALLTTAGLVPMELRIVCNCSTDCSIAADSAAADSSALDSSAAVSAAAHGVEYNMAWLSSKAVASVCAIGNPNSFEKMLERLCARVEPRYRFRDHQAVCALELERAVQGAAKSGAQAIVTTEKDAARMTFLNPCLPVLALQVSMLVDGESEIETMLFKLVGAAQPEYHPNHV